MPRGPVAECGARVTGGPADDAGLADVIDVAAVDDHPIVLDGFSGWVMAAETGIRVVGTAATVDALLAGPGRRAHVVLLDVELGDGTSVEHNVTAIRAAGPAVLVLAASDKPVSVRAAMRAGALGYVLEMRALQLYATGMPMKSVARKMGIKEDTAKQYVGRVREKYARAGRAAPTKLELYYRAVEDGHLPPHP
jgi:two-component system, NarL family, nitrate/nitrite response regulator NarL